MQLWSLTPEQRAEAVRCYKIIDPFKASLFDATRYYVEHVLQFRNSPLVEELVKLLVARMEQNRRRPATVDDVRWRLTRFAGSFQGRRLSEVTVEELRAWFDGLHLGARSVTHFMTKVSQLYNFAIRNRWCLENTVSRLDRPSVEDGEVKVFTVDEASRLLPHANKYGLLPYVSIGLFAGLRAAELKRLDWSAVKLSEQSIIVGSTVAKKRGQRVVDINDTLAAWLAPYAELSGPVTPRNLESRLQNLAETAKVTWKKNGLRHSFCSYHLAMFGDAIKTAYQTGNSVDMIHKHYKALVIKADAERFWALRPAEAAAAKAAPVSKAG